MSDLETFDCDNCSDEFKAYPDAEAAQQKYYSPACHVDGEGL